MSLYQSVGAAGFAQGRAVTKEGPDIHSTVGSLKHRFASNVGVEYRALVFINGETYVHDHMTPSGEKCSGTKVDPFDMARQADMPVLVSKGGKRSFGADGFQVARPGATTYTPLS